MHRNQADVNCKQTDELNVCCNSVICRIIFGLSRLNNVHLIMLRKVSLHRHLFYSSNSVLSALFRIYSFNNYSDDMLSAVTVKPSVAYKHVYDRFYMQAS